MAADLDHGRLFVAELGNDTVGVVDLNSRKAVKLISGLREPQGVGYLPATDTLYVADGGDGLVRMFKGPEYAQAGKIDLGDDADNVRVVQPLRQVLVGYGRGAIAIIDAATRSKVADIALRAHPESLQIASGTDRIYVNVPDAHSVAVADLASRKQITAWPAGDASANFPMALDSDARRVLAVFRNPPKLKAFAMQDGAMVASVDVCGDADDAFVDAKRNRVYVSCGAGAIDVLDARSYSRLARLPTVSGARTSLFVPELDRLFLAVRAAFRTPAAIWIFRPMP